MFLSENLKYLRKSQTKLSQAKLAEQLDISRAALSSYEEGRAEPKLKTLQTIANHFGVTIDQLYGLPLAEVGAENARAEQAARRYASGEQMRVLAVPVDEEGEEQVAFVPDRAEAGYASGYADPEYVSSLARYRLPFLPKHSTYRAFEIVGDSMLPLQSGTIVICEYVANWVQDVREGEPCIVVLRNEGIVFKNVHNRVRQQGELLLKSANPAYEPYGVPVEEVGEVWRFSAYIGKSFPQEDNSSSVDNLKNAVSRLENAVYDLQRKRNGQA